MIALVLASGGFAEVNSNSAKAAVDVHGRPMVQWVMDALSGAERVTRIAVVGLPDGVRLRADKPLKLLLGRGGMLENALAGLAWASRQPGENEYSLLAAADVPAVTPAMIDWRIEQALSQQPFDLDYAVVERQQMQARFPRANRSYLRLAGTDVCGVDVNLVRNGLAFGSDIWNKLLAARKNPLRQAKMFGPANLIGLLLGRINLRTAAARVGDRLGLKLNVHVAPYAELAMDADTPKQLALLRQHLAQREPIA